MPSTLRATRRSELRRCRVSGVIRICVGRGCAAPRHDAVVPYASDDCAIYARIPGSLGS